MEFVSLLRQQLWHKFILGPGRYSAHRRQYE